MPFDAEKMRKLPPEREFLDLNEYWYFANRWLVRLLYPLPVSANAVTFLSLAMGMAAAYFYVAAGDDALFWAAGFLYAKLLLDNVDGNLARARGEESRFGRFLDSFADFVAALLVYAAIAWRLAADTGQYYFIGWGVTAFVLCKLQCSYFVFYLVNYASRAGTYQLNRADESPTAEEQNDFRAGEISPATYYLQKFHTAAYGWQDRLMERLDRASRSWAGMLAADERHDKLWYLDPRFMTLCSPLCLCTNIMLTVAFTLFDHLEWFFPLVSLETFYLLGLQTWKVWKFKTRSVLVS